jgi:hypothetical protein
MKSIFGNRCSTTMPSESRATIGQYQLESERSHKHYQTREQAQHILRINPVDSSATKEIPLDTNADKDTRRIVFSSH